MRTPAAIPGTRPPRSPYSRTVTVGGITAVSGLGGFEDDMSLNPCADRQIEKVIEALRSALLASSEQTVAACVSAFVAEPGLIPILHRRLRAEFGRQVGLTVVCADSLADGCAVQVDALGTQGQQRRESAGPDPLIRGK